MSTAPVDATLRPGERESLVDEVSAELPLWLARSAIPAEDPISELADLLRFDASDLRRAAAVHTCADPAVQRFAATLTRALRAPAPSTQRPRELAPAVRGPIDWPATVRLHAAGSSGTYVTRPRRRTFDTPEQRALRWAVRTLHRITVEAKVSSVERTGETDGSVVAGIDAVRRALRHADRTEWLRDVTPELPTAPTRKRLHTSRNGWMRTVLAPVVEVLLRQRRLDPGTLARILRERYFVPERDWLLHEVVVLIRLDRALCASNVDHVRRSLFSDSGVVAAYRQADGSEIHVLQQHWPAAHTVTSRRQDTAARHGFSVKPSRPDLIVERTGPTPDRVVLELKASRVPSTLGGGLSQLLGYLHERPALFARQPAGWLIPLPWEQLVDAAPQVDQPLWVVPADRVAAAVVARFADDTASSAAAPSPGHQDA